ncbi:MAG: molecular chaperone HtpG, partial [Chlamydiae bacterium]|nr:molecular chaperone HtpG [Chlamydiota bacterium]
MRKNQLSIHSENILPIIKKWLYSDKDIFLRELVSNATDALNKVKILKDQGQAIEGEFEIHVWIDKKAKTIRISDTGIGMTEEEVEKYIAQIAFSGAEEFVAKYKPKESGEPMIGHFGLGFYSAYMVAAKVEIDTLSYLPETKAVFWSCDGTSGYEIGAGTRNERGTDITLFLDEQNLEYLEEGKLRELLERYTLFMPFPIFLNGKAIGNKAPLWIKNPSDCTEKEYVDFYKKLYPLDPDPIFWVHLNVDYPFHLKGILFFPKIHRRFDMNDSAIKLFCNRVFVSESCKDVLPDYMMVLRGAIDSPDIPLNVSRSYLQVDQNVKQLNAHIGKKIADRLSGLFRSEKERYIEMWPEIEMLLKLGSLQDEKFYDRIKDLLIWKNSEGEWRSVEEIAKDTSEKTIYYTTSERESSLLQLYREKKIQVLFAPSSIDTAVLQMLEGKLSLKFQRIDGGIDETLLDKTREKTLLDSDGKTEAVKIASFIQSALDQKDLEVEAKSLASNELPALLVLDEHQRRFRDYMAITQGKGASALFAKKTFIVNT